jgi:arylsulfatase A-like enzyme
MGERGLYLKGPMLYDSLINVGMIARGPGIPSGSCEMAPVTTLDVGATFCDYAGTSLPNEAQSVSLRGCFEGKGSPHEAVYSEWDVAPSRCGVRLDLRTVHTGKAKLTLELRSGDGELYDMLEDPNEMRNLWNEMSASELQKQMLSMLWSRPGIELKDFDDPIGVA